MAGVVYGPGMSDKSHYDRPRDVALIGAGYWGRNLARVLNELGRLGVVCDENATVASEVAASCGVPHASNLDEVLADASLSAVAVATPAATHADVVSKALSAHKDVFVEKPIALQESDARHVAAMADSNGRVLMVGHLLQYHPAFIRLKEIVEQGELGRLTYVYSHRLNLGRVRTEENILWSFAPHDISMILALSGELPGTVEATGHAYLNQNVMDITTTHMEFARGLRAHIFVSWLHPYKEQKLVAIGDQSMAVFDDTNSWDEKLLTYPYTIDRSRGAPVPVKSEARAVPIDAQEPLRVEMEHFLRCCETRDLPRTDAREAIRVLSVLNAAQRSVDEMRSRAKAFSPLDVAAEETRR